jgi:hypothetical protein
MPPAATLPAVLLLAALASCAGARRASTVASADRLPDSQINRVEDDCRHKRDDSLPPGIRDRMCFCIAREYQRTMPAKDALAFGEAYRAVADDPAARNRLLMNNEKARQVLVTCNNEVLGPSKN